MRQPNLFIVGAAKSGTTSMLRYLAQHPEISMPQGREPIYFGRDLISHGYRTGTAEEYSSIFSDAGSAKVVGEKSVWYLYSNFAAEEIRAFNKDAKIIIMLRDPVEMVYSLHQQFISNHNEDVASFDDAVRLVDERAAGRRIPAKAHFPEGLVYTKVPLYSQQVARFLKAFGTDQVRIVWFDEFSSQTAAVYAEVLDFLDVDRSFRPEFAVHNKKMKPRNRAIHQIATHLPRALRERVMWRLERYKIEARRPPMSAETRAFLAQRFRPDVECLGELLGRDLSHWCKAS